MDAAECDAFYDGVFNRHAQTGMPLTQESVIAAGMPAAYFKMAMAAITRLATEEQGLSEPRVSFRLREPNETRAGETEILVTVTTPDGREFHWADTYLVKTKDAND